MSINELLPTLSTLSHADKWQVMQLLVSQLAQEDSANWSHQSTSLEENRRLTESETPHRVVGKLPTAEEEKQVFLARVETLLAEIENWLSGELQVTRQTIEITEFIGTYTAPSLVIRLPQGRKLAEVCPGNAGVVAAEGRIDIHGRLGTEYLYFYLSSPMTMLKVSLGKGEDIIPAGTLVPNIKLHKGIKVDGWYWIDYEDIERAHFLNKSLLLKIISRVSDHDF